jgi:hypothetical protein
MMRAEHPLDRCHDLPFGIVERAVGQGHGFHRTQSPVRLFRESVFSIPSSPP